MTDYIYMANPARIRDLLQKIQTVGILDKLSIQSLNVMGFKSSNDRPLIKVMKAIGFISVSGEPTDRWQRYRNKQIAGAVLAEGIRDHYGELCKIYPDAHIKDNEALRNFFSTHTKVSASTLNLMVLTFKTLCELADFSTILPVSPPQTEQSAMKVAYELEPTIIHKEKLGYTININIQLALPSDATKETFDAFFESMKKYLIA
jgi:hypothetical protein